MKASFKQPRTGITLIELLLVLFILALLAALLFPAVQHARESARRTTCQSHLRQWGVAIQHYESQNATFPPGYRYASPSASFVPPLLSFIEQENLPYSLDYSFGDLRNQQGEKTRIAILICPSTPQKNRFEGTRFFPAAVGDYTSIHGVSASYTSLAGWPEFDPPNENGVLTLEPRTAASVTDGLAATVLLVEDAGRPFLWRNGLAAVGVAKNAAWADPDYEIVLSGSDGLSYGSGEGAGTCVMNCTNDNEVYSFHPGGANLLFADGSVRYVSEQVEARIFAAMITRAQGDHVDFN